ncbi:hypothetical protein OAN61_01140 [bacterium]|nr:hypothetical protein [bacterium]
MIGGKFGKHVALWLTDDPTGGATPYSGVMVTEAIDKSLAALNTTYFDLYQVL